MFHHLFPQMNSINFWGFFGQFTGWTLLVLPAIIASVRRRGNAPLTALVNMAALALLDTSAWMATKSAAQTTVIAFYVCAGIAWVAALVTAFVGKKSTNAGLE